ncbi:leucine-rich repeat domain-containing protein [Aureispira anguillae]|uniref:Leucine-rich repeat domain-containing protein n=1 Tax=Aureispira anguillae TaxID=2864201 RepID=A0A915YDK6_9BACT|nr:leucine-rich repeat domain-containing protein [Aureispira anguillae]BDS11138.1 leucine-rich repeat domain-containing protein [Aureispira anguillae]
MHITTPEDIEANIDNIKSIGLKKVASLPMAIFSCSKLTTLSLRGCNVKRLPVELLHLESLEKLIIIDCGLEELPAWLANLKSLRSLTVSHNKLEELPPDLAFGANELGLNVDFNALTRIPVDYFLPQSRIVALNLNNNQLKALPELKKDCHSLRNLSFRNNRIAFIPSQWFKNLPSLTLVDIRDNPYTRLPLAIFSLVSLKYLSAGGTGLDENFLNTNAHFEIFKAFNAIDLGIEARELVYQLLYAPSTITRASVQDLLDCLCLPYPPVWKVALAFLLEKKKALLKKNPLNKNSEIAVFGKTIMPNRMLRAKIKDKGARYNIKIKDSTTHVVIAPKLKKYEGYDKKDLVFISEEDLLSFLGVEQERFLKKVDPGESELQHLKDLLYHPEEENRAIALNIMLGGGVPKPLMTDLFLIWRNTSIEASFRKKILKLLKLNASTELKSRLSQAKPIMRESLDEYTLDENLRHYTEGTELDAWKIGRYVFKHYKNGLRFWLRHLSKEEERTLLNFLIEKRPQFKLCNSYFQQLEDLFEYTNAKWVVIENANLKCFPKQLLAFKKMWNLSLGHNKLVELPKAFVGLEKLRTLNIKYNNFKVFPPVLLDMISLKVIVVAYSTFTWNKTPVDLERFYYDGITAKRK